MDLLGLAGIAFLLFIKEAGIPIPVPGDLVVITAGVAAAGSSVNPVLGLVVIVVAGIAGGILQFGLVRGPGVVSCSAYWGGWAWRRSASTLSRAGSVGAGRRAWRSPG